MIKKWPSFSLLGDPLWVRESPLLVAFQSWYPVENFVILTFKNIFPFTGVLKPLLHHFIFVRR